MEYELCKYKSEWAVYNTTSRCYILFGSKKELIERVKQLNKK